MAEPAEAVAAGPDYFDARQAQLVAEAAVAQPGVDVEAMPPERRIHQMRMEDESWEDIAEELGMTVGNARLAHMRYLQGGALENAAEARVADREMALRQLDSIAKPHWVPARAGNLDSGKFLLSVINQKGKIQGLEREESESGETRTIVVVDRGDGSYVDDLKRIADEAERKRQQANAQAKAIDTPREDIEDAEVVGEG